jgi:hypothetical protein
MIGANVKNKCECEKIEPKAVNEIKCLPVTITFKSFGSAPNACTKKTAGLKIVK